MNDNYTMCLSIADKLDAIVNGDYYKCPECEETFDASEMDSVCCPYCGNAEDIEVYDLYDYLSDTDLYDIEYRTGNNREYRSVCIMIACGGPNIYIDTKAKAIELYWWGDHEHALLSDSVIDAIDEYFAEFV